MAVDQLFSLLCMLVTLTFLLLPVIAELEEKFKNNERRMEKQRLELDKLKDNATSVRDEIRHRVQNYNTCVRWCLLRVISCCSRGELELLLWLENRKFVTNENKTLLWRFLHSFTGISSFTHYLQVLCHRNAFNCPCTVWVLNITPALGGVHVFKLLQ